jgi:hypothetical protein
MSYLCFLSNSNQWGFSLSNLSANLHTQEVTKTFMGILTVAHLKKKFPRLKRGVRWRVRFR